MHDLEVMKLALEALEKERPYLGPMPTLTSKAIAALKEKLAQQAERERKENLDFTEEELELRKKCGLEWLERFKSDTVAQKGGCTWCGGDCPQFECDTHSTWMNEPVIRRDMTAHRAAYFMERFKHEEKLLGPNEQAALDFVISILEAQPEQEPVAWISWNRVSGESKLNYHKVSSQHDKSLWQHFPLYTTPPQRKPLTNEQIEAQKADWFHPELNLKPETIFHRGIRAAEATHGIKE